MRGWRIVTREIASLQTFFGLSACSWVPHFACHHYRLETKSGFVLGDWEFSRAESGMMLGVYALLILMNLGSIAWAAPRLLAALTSGLGHLALGLLHFYRLEHPFRFEVFGYPWSLSASLREAVIVASFGLVCLVIAARLAVGRGLGDAVDGP